MSKEIGSNFFSQMVIPLGELFISGLISIVIQKLFFCRNKKLLFSLIIRYYLVEMYVQNDLFNLLNHYMLLIFRYNLFENSIMFRILGIIFFCQSVNVMQKSFLNSISSFFLLCSQLRNINKFIFDKIKIGKREDLNLQWLEL